MASATNRVYTINLYYFSIKTQLKCRYIYTQLIEEIGRHPGIILACRDIFGLAHTSSSLGKIFTNLTGLGHNFQIF